MKIKFRLDNQEEKKSLSYLVILIILIFLTTVFITNAAYQWISIQQVSKDDSGNLPIDVDSNGVIDESSYSTSAVISNLGSSISISSIAGKQLVWLKRANTLQSKEVNALCTYETITPYFYPYCVYFDTPA